MIRQTETLQDRRSGRQRNYRIDGWADREITGQTVGQIEKLQDRWSGSQRDYRIDGLADRETTG